MKILFIIPSFSTGGAERMLVRLANYFNKNNFEVTIICLKKHGANINWLDNGIHIINVNTPRIYFSIFRIAKVIRKEQPDIVFSGMGYLNAYLSFFIPFFPKRIVWVCRETSIPSMRNKEYRLSWLFEYLYRFYNRYNAIICQSSAMAEDLMNNFKVKREKITLINNPVDFGEVEYLKDRFTGVFPRWSIQKTVQLLYVGSLRPIKRVSLLVEVLALLPDKYYLTIIGDGPDAADIKELISRRGVSYRVRMINNCVAPFPFYAGADCMLLCSQFEGFPNVVLESFACGCPVIGFNIDGGANEALNNYGGFVVKENNLNDFASQIKKVCEDDNINKQVIIDECRDKFSVEKIMAKYRDLLNLKFQIVA